MMDSWDFRKKNMGGISAKPRDYVWNTWFEPSYADPSYMQDDAEHTEELDSNNDYGNTLYRREREIMVTPPRRGAYHPPGQPRDWENMEGIAIDTRNRWGRGDEGISGPGYPYFTGGTFLHPEYLPPVRTTQIQGARLV